MQVTIDLQERHTARKEYVLPMHKGKGLATTLICRHFLRLIDPTTKEGDKLILSDRPKEGKKIEIVESEYRYHLKYKGKILGPYFNPTSHQVNCLDQLFGREIRTIYVRAKHKG
jgi:hypothetical protein